MNNNTKFFLLGFGTLSLLFSTFAGQELNAHDRIVFERTEHRGSLGFFANLCLPGISISTGIPIRAAEPPFVATYPVQPVIVVPPPPPSRPIVVVPPAPRPVIVVPPPPPPRPIVVVPPAPRPVIYERPERWPEPRIHDRREESGWRTKHFDAWNNHDRRPGSGPRR